LLQGAIRKSKKKRIDKMDCLIKMIIGFLFLAFNFQVTIGGITFDIIPDVVGYVLIIWSCKEMIEWGPCFKKTRKHAIIALIISFCSIIAQNVSPNFTIQGTLLGLETIAFIYLSYYIMEGMYVKNKTEKIYELNSQLRGAWIAMAVSRFIYCFCMLTDFEALTEELGIAGAEGLILSVIHAVAFVIEVFFLLLLNQNRMLLDEKKKTVQKSE